MFVAYSFTYTMVSASFLRNVPNSRYTYICNGHCEWSKLLLPRLWPVLLTLDLVVLLEVGEHDYYGWSLLPHETPEVHQSSWQWSYK